MKAPLPGKGVAIGDDVHSCVYIVAGQDEVLIGTEAGVKRSLDAARTSALRYVTAF
jgi:hypothetical protein